jgi:hypothetical protein
MMQNTVLKAVCLIVLCSCVFAVGQVRENAYFPDIGDYQTLACDFHMHSVFSDGLVWPTVRVAEAWREGLDALALTDHLEYQPHKDDIPTQHNRPYAIAAPSARQMDIVLIKASEITRGTPPGHYNALFLQDCNALDTDEFLDAIEAANQQDAFVFWNHHAWKGIDKGQWEDVQTQMIDKQWLHGMEVANGGSYYRQAHKWCLDKNLTMLGNSDVHGPLSDKAYTPDKHRTLTLVFAKERSSQGIREALFQGRTAVWIGNDLYGRQAYLEPLFQRSIQVAAPHYKAKDEIRFVVTNNAFIDLTLKRVGDYGPGQISLPAHAKTIVRTKINPEGQTQLSYRVDNLHIDPDTGLLIDWTIAESLTIK